MGWVIWCEELYNNIIIVLLLIQNNLYFKNVLSLIDVKYLSSFTSLFHG